MADSKFLPGTVVKLKSGGPPMTVRETDERRNVFVEWFNQSQAPQKAAFHEIMLEEVREINPNLSFDR